MKLEIAVEISSFLSCWERGRKESGQQANDLEEKEGVSVHLLKCVDKENVAFIFTSNS